MRSFCVAAIAAGLMFAPMAVAEPLAPGKPAGVKEARHGASTGLLIIGGVAVVALVAVLTVGKSSNNNTGVVNVGSSASTS